MLLKPLFLADSNLGVSRFGVISAFQSIGMIFASILLTKVDIKIEKRANIMLPALILQSVFFFLGVLINKFYIMCICFFIGIIGSIPILFSKSAKKALNYNPKIQKLEDVRS